MKNALFQEDVEVLELEEVGVEDMVKEESKLFLFNDDVNTFDYVIQTLVEVCGHSHEQAEQCAFIVHFKGKCIVKTGAFKKLVPMRNEICRRGISAEVY